MNESRTARVGSEPASAALARRIGCLLLACIAVAGCSTPDRDAGVGTAPHPRLPALTNLPSGRLPSDASAVEPVAALVVLAIQQVEDAAALDAVFSMARGREAEFFAAVFERSALEMRDVSLVFHRSARELVAAEGPPGAAIAIRELRDRECCTRRSFLAAALVGVAEGLGLRGEEAIQDAATVARLVDLAGHADREIATGAREAMKHYRVDASPR